METRFYQAQGLDIERIAIELERMFLLQGYQVQHFGEQNHTVVQFKKGGDFAAIVGMQAALTLTLQTSPGGVMAVIGQQKWADKAAAGAVGMLILWPLAFTAGAGAIRQSNLANQLLNALDAVVRQQNASVKTSPIPPQMLPPQVQQQLTSSSSPPHQARVQQAPPPQWMPPPPPPSQPSGRSSIQQAQARANIQCASCATLNAADDIYCARCGKALAPPKAKCPQCGAPIKPDAAFCTKCGTSFSTQAPATEPTMQVDMTPKTQPAVAANTAWGYLVLTNGTQLELTGVRITIGRTLPGSGDGQADINLYEAPQSGTVSRMHAVIERVQSGFTLTDLNSTNLTRLNGLKLSPNEPVSLTNGSICEFGQVRCSFKSD